MEMSSTDSARHPGGDFEISREWLKKVQEEEFGVGEHELSSKMVKAYSLDVVRFYGGYTVYGVRTRVNRKTGQATVRKKLKALVEKVYERVCRMNKKRYSALGFFVGVSGDLQNCHKFYNPDIPKEPSKYELQAQEQEEDPDDDDEEEVAKGVNQEAVPQQEESEQAVKRPKVEGEEQAKDVKPEDVQEQEESEQEEKRPTVEDEHE